MHIKTSSFILNLFWLDVLEFFLLLAHLKEPHNKNLNSAIFWLLRCPQFKIVNSFISETLPHTAYMKMIDIWLFCGLIFPFVIICALTILDYMIIKENDRRNTNLAGQSKQIWNSKKALKSMQIILPTITGIGLFSYWVYGIYMYNCNY